MKRIIIICFTLMLVVTGGCSINDKQNSKDDNNTEAVKPIDMDPKDLPKVPAFQDKVTREYMASTKEVEPEYYLLESKLKGFTMLFPENSVNIPKFTNNDGEDFESIGFESNNPKTNILFYGTVRYYHKESFLENSETMLDKIRGQNGGYKGDFKKEIIEGREIYFAHEKDTFDDLKRKYNYSYSYFGFVKSTEEDALGIQYDFTFGCFKDDQPCSLNEKEARKKVIKIIHSITFNKDKKEQKNGK
ncbi:lipoprotein YvcA [Bacillus sp. CLL-7-23]|uniref:Lipoprotein YvcA n=1 Tax=Bacillus changyiensis TaxID=3004103 RepID=A0ABT4WZG7_9BACI|nr:lipoprotein YvcA [Bacillus changyiensis]MDA7025343.1 lipoprotein YvcA [Bacillus changyiensis]